jgi:hypothetical protein
MHGQWSFRLKEKAAPACSPNRLRTLPPPPPAILRNHPMEVPRKILAQPRVAPGARNKEFVK